MTHDWGSVDGDRNADAILSDRAAGKKSASWVGAFFFATLIGAGAWYANSGSPKALAATIFAAVLTVVARVNEAVYETHTFVLIAERRAQLAEQVLRDIQVEQAIRR